MARQKTWRQTNIGALCATLLVSVGLVLGFAAPAAAITCQSFVNPAEFGRFWAEGPYGHTVLVGRSGQYTVASPPVSYCKDINVSNITHRIPNAQPNDCGWWRVRFYPTSGGNYATNWVYRCSTPPSGDLEAIATNVINGSRYRVEYVTGLISVTEQPIPAFRYTIWH